MLFLPKSSNRERDLNLTCELSLGEAQSYQESVPRPGVPISTCESDGPGFHVGLDRPDASADRQLQFLCRIAGDMLAAPIAIVSLRDKSRQQRLAAGSGLDVDPTSHCSAFCNHVLLGPALVVPDTRADARFAENPLVIGPPFIRSFAGVPLVVERRAVGTLCVFDRKPRRFSSRKLNELCGIASVVASWLTLQKHSRARDQLSKDRSRMLDLLARQKRDIWALANHDTLTGIANRAFFESSLERALETARDHGSALALAVLDIDHLKDANNTYGHRTGDAILVEAAARIRASVCESDFAGRIGGDKFGLILHGVRTTNGAIDLIESVQRRLAGPVAAHGAQLSCAASAGLVMFPDHANDSAELLNNAETALYSAKETARGSLVVFNQDMRLKAMRRLVAEKDIRQALDGDRIFPCYQPKICSATGELIGFEALMRWMHPEKGLQTPASIEGILDDPDLGVRLGDRMMALVARDMRNWLDLGLDFGRVFVNASITELRRPTYANQVLSHLMLSRISPQCLGIEMTETGFLGGNTETLHSELKKLSGAGVSIALDDFGTGYGSLAHLLQFPIDCVKIDRSFILRMETDPEADTIINAMIGLARSLDLDLVAEGVETLAQFELLRDKGCPAVQGFFVSRPLPADAIPELVGRFRCEARSSAISV